MANQDDLLNTAPLSTIPYNEPITPYGSENNITSFAWLEWFRQIQGKINALLSATESKAKAFGMMISNTTQSHTATNTPKAITFDTNAFVDGQVTLVDNTKIYVPTAGLYMFTFSSQLTAGSSSVKNAYFWPRINGVNIPGSTMKYSISGSGTTVVITRPGVFELQVGDYLEAFWAVDDTTITLTAVGASSFAPAVPSVSLQICQIIP